VKKHWFRPVVGSEPETRGPYWCEESKSNCYNCEGPCEVLMGKKNKKANQRAREKLKAALANPQPEPEVRNAILANPNEETHRVSLVKDITTKFPGLHLEVFFSMPGHEKAFGEVLARTRCRLAESLETADLLIFPGGSDVSPGLYGADDHPMTKANPSRDKHEMELYAEAVRAGIPMFGVCRGAQFLHVMQGGELYQHCDGHNTSHQMVDLTSATKFDRIPSTHHQMVKKAPNLNMEIVAISRAVSTFRAVSPLELERGADNDIEAVWYPEVCAFTVQGHPEYRGYSAYSKWVFERLEHYIVNNPKVKPVQTVKGHSNYRLQRVKEILLLENNSEKGKE